MAINLAKSATINSVNTQEENIMAKTTVAATVNTASAKENKLMANKKSNKVVINDNAIKEDNNMAVENMVVNDIINTFIKENSMDKSMTTVNVSTAAKKNKATLIKRAGTTYLQLNGFTCGVIGGTPQEQENNISCIQFMIDQCDYTDNAMELALQCDMLMKVMANLEGVDLSNIVSIGGTEYAVDTALKEAYNEMGDKVLSLAETYPDLASDELSDETVQAILVGELTRQQDVIDMEEEDEDDLPTLEIIKDRKLTVLETIRALRELGLSSSWFNVEGQRQPMPICYNGVGDLRKFSTIVEDCLNNDKSYLDVMLASCRAVEEGLDIDEENVTIGDTECVIDYTKRELWDASVTTKLADLEDIEATLPKEAVKVMLAQRGKTEIDRIAAEAKAIAEAERAALEGWYDEEEDEDEEGYCGLADLADLFYLD